MKDFMKDFFPETFASYVYQIIDWCSSFFEGKYEGNML